MSPPLQKLRLVNQRILRMGLRRLVRSFGFRGEVVRHLLPGSSVQLRSHERPES